MCGISGIVQVDDRALDFTLLEAMSGSLVHRGPDGEGYVLLSGQRRDKPLSVSGKLSNGLVNGRYIAGLGHQRLAIVDLTPLGHQPMGTEDGQFWITYNGEVYNAPELRGELMALGHRFRSSSDTEVVLEAFRRWGHACLDRLNGMFAFAVWDDMEERLFCARDRFGIKPFYYRWDTRQFLFASEIKALLLDPSYRRVPNQAAILDYLILSRHDHTSETFFQGIHQLAPGEWLTVRQRNGRESCVERKRWWRLPGGIERVSEDEAAARTRELLEDSVRLALRADVQVGSCLSGGLDSSAIVCLMSRVLVGDSQNRLSHGRAENGALKVPLTFSSCHKDPRFDERPYIRAVLARTGAVNNEVFPDPERLFGNLMDILWHQEEPFAGTSVLAQWEVMRSAGAAGVKVLLDGQGADELFLGYPGYMGSRLADCIRTGQWIVGAREWRAWRRVHGGLQPTALAGIARGLLPGGPVGWLRSRILGDDEWLARDFARRERRPRPFWDPLLSSGRTVLGAHMARGLLRDLPALLHYEDRNAMAFSVEARVPFLDHRLVEWLARLPPELELRQGMTKMVLREAMAGILPEEVRLRSDKMGFATPEDHWLRVALRPHIETMLESKSMGSRPYWRMPVLKAWYRRYCDGQLAVGPTVWRWINLECWLRRFCD